MDPVLGTFTSEDPAKDGGNWYVYCDNNPTNRIDETGKNSVFLDLVILGAAIKLSKLAQALIMSAFFAFSLAAIIPPALFAFIFASQTEGFYEMSEMCKGLVKYLSRAWNITKKIGFIDTICEVIGFYAAYTVICDLYMKIED